MKFTVKSSRVSATTMARFLFACILLLCAATAALAQAGRGSVNGLVTDPTGAIVPGAKITLLNHATGITLHSITTSGGLYSFISLNPGVYKVTASMKGFQGAATDDVHVTVDQVSTVNIALSVGSVSEVVTVTESTSLVEASNSTVGQLISAQTIDRVPLLTRNVFDLAQLSPGVTPANGTPNSSTAQAISSITSGRPGVDVSSYTINGAIQGSVYYMLDGSPLGIAENNAAAIIPAMEIPEDGVDETRVETQNTPASYQSGGAGVISLVSKSGGNNFHGDAFGVFRPNAMAANEYFNKQQGTVRHARFSPLSGGRRYQWTHPAQEAFLLWGLRRHAAAALRWIQLFTVPTTAERTGDFSADSFTIYDPTLPDNSDGTRQAFANNTITNPNPTALKFLSEFPKCNVGAPAAIPLLTAPRTIYSCRDWIQPRRISSTFAWTRPRARSSASSDAFLSSPRLFSLRASNAFDNPCGTRYYAQNVTNGTNTLVADDITLNPTTVLQLRYSFTRHYEDQGGAPRQTGYDLTTLGFPSALSAAGGVQNSALRDFNDVGGGIGGTANWNTFILPAKTAM